ncbi:hypothetical protein SDC9_197256 [bioreactor metagenome]|uniref:Uncharacterized protein n=1 Tax=bioreactor metagenome TaxID=1076179 RepID=A0A645IMT5_9ZZZZ
MRTEVFIKLFRMHKPRHGKPVFGHIVKYAVPAGNDRTRLKHLAVAPRKDRLHRALRHAFGDAEQVERELWFSSHGVYIR